MSINTTNIDTLLEAYRQKLGITEEEEEQLILELKDKSAPTQDMSNVAESVATNIEDIQALAEMVSSLLEDVENLKAEVEELKQ